MNAWSADLEGVLEGIRQNSVIMSNEYKYLIISIKKIEIIKLPK